MKTIFIQIGKKYFLNKTFEFYEKILFEFLIGFGKFIPKPFENF